MSVVIRDYEIMIFHPRRRLREAASDERVTVPGNP
jgi:hypothetical protein